MPTEIVDSFTQSVLQEPENLEETYQQFMQIVSPYPMGNTHLRFWAWFMGNGTVTGALADFLAAMMNPNLGGENHAANLVETQVINWCKQIVSFPEEASGLLVSGGSMANFVGLAVARNAKSKKDIREYGVTEGMVLYSSVEVHSSNDKAIELLGLGNSAFRKIPTNTNYEIDIELLIKTIAADREAGLTPFCVIGSAGTINTGSVDDLNALADLCRRENLWFHIDGAIGAVLAIAPKNKHLVEGLHKADSVAMDLHKWMHVPFEAGCVLIKDEKNTGTHSH
jgi:aromatic-L-amino-acid decarboxylase